MYLNILYGEKRHYKGTTIVVFVVFFYIFYKM